MAASNWCRRGAPSLACQCRCSADKRTPEPGIEVVGGQGTGHVLQAGFCEPLAPVAGPCVRLVGRGRVGGAQCVDKAGVRGAQCCGTLRSVPGAAAGLGRVVVHGFLLRSGVVRGGQGSVGEWFGRVRQGAQYMGVVRGGQGYQGFRNSLAAAVATGRRDGGSGGARVLITTSKYP